jgi:hypothetical protein
VRAIDTNVLVFAEIASSIHHRRAAELLRGLAEGAAPWAIPWPCLYEFVRVVTHPRVYHPPAPLDLVLAHVASLLASPSLVLLAETSRHAEVMMAVVRGSGATGNLLHDAHIAALCLEHGVSELLSGDRDFLRFAGLRVTNPFAAGG